MPRLPRITATDLRRALERDGWFTVRQEGSHVQLPHPTKSGRVTIAVHKRQIVDPKTLQSALRQAGLTPADLQRLL